MEYTRDRVQGEILEEVLPEVSEGSNLFLAWYVSS